MRVKGLSLGIPAYTRIILIPDNREVTREYGISRLMVITLLILFVAGLSLTTLLMISFAEKHDERQRIDDLQTRLTEARMSLQLVSELQTELETMRGFQEKLLYMLGIEEGASGSADTLLANLDRSPATAAEALARAAAISGGPKPTAWPVAGFVTGEFVVGQQARGITPHLGIDIAAPTDTPVLSPADGVVARVGVEEFLGNFVEIQHGLGYLTVYGHCSRIAVGKGAKVDAGQIIAYVGQSGRSSAPHLHYEIWKQGEAVDPRELLVGQPPRD